MNHVKLSKLTFWHLIVINIIDINIEVTFFRKATGLLMCKQLQI